MIWRRLAERRFLIDRYVKPSPWDHDTGVSSDALLRYAMTGVLSEYDHPHDRGDLDRCERLFAAAPRHLQRKMEPILIGWREYVNTEDPERPS